MPVFKTNRVELVDIATFIYIKTKTKNILRQYSVFDFICPIVGNPDTSVSLDKNLKQHL